MAQPALQHDEVPPETPLESQVDAMVANASGVAAEPTTEVAHADDGVQSRAEIEAASVEAMVQTANEVATDAAQSVVEASDDGDPSSTTLEDGESIPAEAVPVESSPVAVSSPEMIAPVPAPVPAPEVRNPTIEADAAATASEVSGHASAPAHTPAPILASTPAPTPAHVIPALEPKNVHGSRAVTGRAAHAVVGFVRQASSRIGGPVMKVLSWPLAGRSKTVRDSVGWVTLNTLFWCGCLWTWLLFFRHPSETHAETAAFDFAHSEVIEAAKPADEHAGAAGGHGGGAAAEGAHGAEAKGGDAHGAPADDGHGSSAAKPATADRRGVARREMPNRSPSAKPKTEAKKEAAKGGH